MGDKSFTNTMNFRLLASGLRKIGNQSVPSMEKITEAAKGLKQPRLMEWLIEHKNEPGFLERLAFFMQES